MSHSDFLATAGGLLLELAHIPPGFRLTSHGHEHLHLCAVLDGAFRERERGGDELCASGAMRLSPAGARHDLTFGPEGAICLLVLAPAEVAPPDARPRRHQFRRDDGDLRALATAVARRIGRDAPRPDGDLAVDGYAFELLAQCSRRTTRSTAPAGAPPGWLRRARELLHDRLAAPPSVVELAREAGVHRAHLMRAYREHFGLTPGAYVRAARAERARGLILRTRAPLSQVAADVGFADQSHMTRALRAAYGVSPGAMRATAVRERARQYA
jgi:AraC family transcriptional regulator